MTHSFVVCSVAPAPLIGIQKATMPSPAGRTEAKLAGTTRYNTRGLLYFALSTSTVSLSVKASLATSSALTSASTTTTTARSSFSTFQSSTLNVRDAFHRVILLTALRLFNVTTRSVSSIRGRQRHSAIFSRPLRLKSSAAGVLSPSNSSKRSSDALLLNSSMIVRLRLVTGVVVWLSACNG